MFKDEWTFCKVLNLFSCTRLLSEPAGIGRFDGEQGRRSSGQPLSGDVDLPSPRLCHTRALGHEITTAWTIADKPRIRPRCCGQLHSSAKTDVAAFSGNAEFAVAVDTVTFVDVADVLFVLLNDTNAHDKGHLQLYHTNQI